MLGTCTTHWNLFDSFKLGLLLICLDIVAPLKFFDTLPHNVGLAEGFEAHIYTRIQYDMAEDSPPLTIIHLGKARTDTHRSSHDIFRHRRAYRRMRLLRGEDTKQGPMLKRRGAAQDTRTRACTQARTDVLIATLRVQAQQKNSIGKGYGSRG